MSGELAESKISSRGQTAIPSSVQRYLELEKGDRVTWKLENGKVTIEKKKE